MNTTAIDQMSREEKLRDFEGSWDAFTREATATGHPAGVSRSLKETQRRYDAGAEASMDWATCKCDRRR